MSRSMPRKTRQGAEAAARWHAFRRYLASIQRFDQLGAPGPAAEIFDRYLPYAVAFGLDRSWVAAFAAVGPTVTPWYLRRPMGDSGRPNLADVNPADALRLVGDLRLGDLSAPDLPDVDLQQVSDLVGGALQVSSEGLFALLDAAGEAFSSFDFDI
jgi:hypothetical protein